MGMDTNVVSIAMVVVMKSVTLVRGRAEQLAYLAGGTVRLIVPLVKETGNRYAAAVADTGRLSALLVLGWEP